VERNVLLGLVIAFMVLLGLLAGGAELMTFIVVFSVLGIVALTFMAVRRTIELNAALEAARPPPPMVVPEHRTTRPPVRPARPAAPKPPPPVTVTRLAPPKGDLKARIAEVKAAIDARPGGVPRELGLFDSWTIAERVVKGKTMTAPDGTPLVLIMGEWYVNTPGDRKRFLNPWKG
jgi:hypothetical protein